MITNLIYMYILFYLRQQCSSRINIHVSYNILYYTNNVDRMPTPYEDVIYALTLYHKWILKRSWSHVKLGIKSAPLS